MLEVLQQFSQRANENGDVRRVVGAWTVDLVLAACDADERWVLEVRDGCIVSVQSRAVDEGDSRQVEVSGTRAVLEALFSGGLNPVRAATRGDLEIYGDMSDQTRLDAVALILWGP
jgi:hypothetical protein